MQTESDRPAEVWAVVEVMGHSRYAGRISQDTTLGAALIRVEVPAVEGCPAFEKLLAPASIFAITPCSKDLAIEAAKRFQSRPFTLIELSDVGRPRLAAPVRDFLIADEEDEDDYLD